MLEVLDLKRAQSLVYFLLIELLEVSSIIFEPSPYFFDISEMFCCIFDQYLPLLTVVLPIFGKSQKAYPQFSVLSLPLLLISSQFQKLKSLEIVLLFITYIINMNLDIKYELILKNNNNVQGNIKVKIGLPMDDFKIKIFEKEGFKNAANFVNQDETQVKITTGTKIVVFVEKCSSKKASRISQRGSRKMSFDSLYQQSSMDFENDHETFVVNQPQKPPIVRGTLRRVNKLFCCMTSGNYMELRINHLNFYNSRNYETIQRSIEVKQIHKVRSFRKKDLYFLSLQLDNQLLEFSFINSNLCKEWMGYLMQSMEFARFLCQKRDFSKAESFKKYMQSLKEQQEKMVVLSEGRQLQTIHETLPTEKEIKRRIKKLIKFRQFEVEYKIGSGSFSIVYLARKKGQAFALKQLSKDSLLSKNQMKYVFTELSVLIKCRECRYVIPLYYAFQTMDYLYLALQYIPAGDLSQQILSKGIFSNNEALILLAELVYTIQFLHKNKIIFRDLKPDNIMLDQKGHMFLVDYGLAKQLSSQDDYAQSFLGTPIYLAPERFKGSGAVNFKSDIYGVGCIFYEILHGQSAFQGTNYQSLAEKIRNDQPQFRKDLPSDFLSFLHSTLQKDPDRRLSQMSKHSIFKSINWKTIAQRQHQGIKIQDVSSTNSVQISYRIDEDYNEQTYPNKFINNWEFNYAQFQ